jgi:acylphosphatase
VPAQKHVYYSGLVQGVGFRYTARRLAQDRGLAGWVRNLADGRVELVVEGEPATVEVFLADVAEAMGRSLRRADVSDEPATGAFHGFGIRPSEG